MKHDLSLPDRLLNTLLAESRTAATREICGFLARSPNGWSRYAVANRAARAGSRFEMDTSQQIEAFRLMRQTGAHLAAIYHSHPGGEAEPSIHDVRGHGYPQVLALIIAPSAVDAAPVRAWQMIDPNPREVTLRRSSATWIDAFL